MITIYGCRTRQRAPPTRCSLRYRDAPRFPAQRLALVDGDSKTPFGELEHRGKTSHPTAEYSNPRSGERRASRRRRT